MAKAEEKEQADNIAKEELKEKVKEEAKEQPQEEVKEEAKETKKAKATQDSKETKKWSSEIKKLGDKIVGLKLLQAKELGDYLKEEYGIEPAAGGAVMMAGPATLQAEEAEEKTSFNVILKEYGDKKIQVIKEVRALTGLGLKEAKDLVDNAPKLVKEGLSKEEAESVQHQLEAVGAVVELT